MSWDLFFWFALAAVLCWAVGAFFAWKGRPGLVYAFTLAGLAIFFAFILGMWISLERPPLRTMGETRLWYSFFLPLAGIIIYSRWRYKWILSFSTLLALVFICVNLFKPEIHSKALMPALQSPWFAPHVIVYMFSYALLGAATLMAVYLLFFKRFPVKPGMTGDNVTPGPERFPVKPGMTENNVTPGPDRVSPTDDSCHSRLARESLEDELNITDNLVYVGLAFLTIGMLFGALWAKEAWGHYWAWDPKETWAAITWLCYLLYIHFRRNSPKDWKKACWILLLAFVCLQICWWGINYLPSARGLSIHTYNVR